MRLKADIKLQCRPRSVRLHSSFIIYLLQLAVFLEYLC